MKIWLIQNVIAPYRVPLFASLAQVPTIEFRVIVLAKGMENHPHWKCDLNSLPFDVVRVPGWALRLGYERIVCVNPRLLVRMFLEKPDAVICAGFSFATLMACIYKVFSGSKIVVWMEGTEYTEETLPRWRIAFRREIMRRASAVVDAGSLSRAYVKSLLRAGREIPFFTSYNCVEIARFRKHPNIADRADHLGSSCSQRELLYVGQLVERKGVLTLMEVFRAVSQRYKHRVGLTLVGKGPLEGRIKAICDKRLLKNVHLTGLVEYEMLPAFYWKSDLFIILSTDDPNPLVLFEALSAGLPVICSNRIGNAMEFISEGVNGFVVDPLDVEVISMRIIEVLAWGKEAKDRSAAVSRQLLAKVNYEDSARAFIDASAAAMAQY